MLTHDVRVAFSPKSMVTGLTISKDGSALAWSEKNGTLALSINGLENKYISIDGREKPTKRVNILFRCTETGKAHYAPCQRAKKFELVDK